MTTPVTNTSTQAASAATTSTSKTDALTNKDVFMQLLVAQIKNQNPLNPSDSIQFLSQLAQFSSLEQFLAMRQSLDAIQQTLSGSQASDSKTDSAIKETA